MKRCNNGFTLMELLVVMLIISILFTISFTAYKSFKQAESGMVISQIKAEVKIVQSISKEREDLTGVLIYSRPGHKETLIQLFEQKTYDIANQIYYIKKISDARPLTSDLAILGVGETLNLETSNNPRMIVFNHGELTFIGRVLTTDNFPAMLSDPISGNTDWNLKVTDRSVPGLMIYKRDLFNAQTFATQQQRDNWLTSFSDTIFVQLFNGEMKVHL